MVKTSSRERPLKEKIVSFLLGLLTLGAWGILVIALLWILAAVGWYLLARLWVRELFVPEAVSITVFAILLATLWAVLLGWGMLLWSLYHYHLYHRHDRRRLAPLALRAPRLPWQELRVVPPCPFPSVNLSHPHEKPAAPSSRAFQLPVLEIVLEMVSSGAQEAAASGEKKGPEGGSPDSPLIPGRVLKEDLRDETGKVVVAAGEVVTPEAMERAIAHGLYGELIARLAEEKR
ncbi:MAG TPA: hypothetical protein ENM97_01105 [Moorella mulderi]|nr:hypothetical protein [Moorella mulderi]